MQWYIEKLVTVMSAQEINVLVDEQTPDGLTPLFLVCHQGFKHDIEDNDTAMVKANRLGIV